MNGLFPVEPWRLRETRLDLDVLPRSEALFALSNGHVGVRGNLDEGEPHGIPGSYLNSVHERRPLPYAEGGFGYPEAGETVLNVTNGKIMRLLVDDEPFDVRYGDLLAHERVLDFRTGLLHRSVEWRSPAGQAVRVRSTRLVSFTQRAVLAIAYEVEPVDGPARLTLQSELVTNEQLPEQDRLDPRVAAALHHPLVHEDHRATATGGHLVHSTKQSEIRLAVAMDHVVQAPADVQISSDAAEDWARVTATVQLEPGQVLRVVKFVAYGWSASRSLPAVRDQVAAALAAVRHTGWDQLVADQRTYLDAFWDRADVEVDGDPELQQAVRFALFHVLQAGARGERRPIAAKGLTGPGYDGHCFWDTETFVVPVLTHTVPKAAADLLRWRQSTLPEARERAEQLGLRGATFPWRTITGRETSGYWPAGTAAFHINADIADAAVRHVSATGDREFERDVAVELLVETARLWRSLGHHDAQGQFRIDGVTGPDEYSALADNNVFTNLMARRNLREAAAVCRRHGDVARTLGVDAEETASWRDAADKMCIPYDDELGVHPQSEGFTDHEVWDFARTDPDQYPLMLHFPYVQLYRKQVIKQSDLVLAMQLCGEEFTAEQKRRNVDYYEAVNVRDSSLSACTQAVMCAEVGHLELAYDYAVDAAMIDLHDLDHNTRQGLHIASLAGAWAAVVAGFGGMRDEGGHLLFRPALPPGLDRIAFRLLRGDAHLHVEVTREAVTYAVDTGGPLTLTHHGEEVVVEVGSPVTRPLHAQPALPRPEQPHGRAPLRRSDRTAAGA